jgi:hypothetical protein
MEILLPEFKQILLLLKKHNVDYIVIGGYAVIYHGYARTTVDIDILLKPDNHIRKNLIAALKEFGISQESLDQIELIDLSKAAVFYFGDKPRRIDFLTKISGVNFNEAIETANHFRLEDDDIAVIDFNHLLINKMISDRLKDKADVEELQKIAKYRKKS